MTEATRSFSSSTTTDRNRTFLALTLDRQVGSLFFGAGACLCHLAAMEALVPYIVVGLAVFFLVVVPAIFAWQRRQEEHS